MAFKIRMIAATALIATSFTPVAIPTLALTPAFASSHIASTSTCLIELGALPSSGWEWDDPEYVRTTYEWGTKTYSGASRNAHANRTEVHTFSCTAYNPADRSVPGQSGTFTEDGDTVRLKVCQNNSTVPLNDYDGTCPPR
jgi:hypothetical protein